MQWTASCEMVKQNSGQDRAVSADTNMRHYIVSRLELHVLSTLTLSAVASVFNQCQ